MNSPDSSLVVIDAALEERGFSGPVPVHSFYEFAVDLGGASSGPFASLPAPKASASIQLFRDDQIVVMNAFGDSIDMGSFE